MPVQKGFTLLDLVIATAAAGIFAAIAIPAYQEYMRDKSDRACMAEAGAYAKQVLAAMHAGHAVAAPALHACKHIDSAQTMSLRTPGVLNASARPPGGKPIQCDLAKDGRCHR